MDQFIKNIKVFIVGAAGYSTLEILFRGFTHWTMSITGGICFVLLYHMNKHNEKTPLWQRGLKGALIITTVEFFVGCIVNIGLGWNVWDYSSYSFNIFGQICLAFTLLWFLLCMPLPYLFRFLRIS